MHGTEVGELLSKLFRASAASSRHAKHSMHITTAHQPAFLARLVGSIKHPMLTNPSCADSHVLNVALPNWLPHRQLLQVCQDTPFLPTKPYAIHRISDTSGISIVL